MSDEIAKLKSELEEWKKRYSEVTGEGSNYRKLQVENDDLHQSHKDKDAAHAKAIDDLKAAHADQIAELKTYHQKAVESLQSANSAIVDQHKQDVSALKQSHAEEIQSVKLGLRNEHAAHVAELKSKSLVPALQDLHARQQEDLAKSAKALADKHAADLEALKNG